MNNQPDTPVAIMPLRFQPSFEQIPDDEAETSRELAETLRQIMETTFKDNGHANRSVHAKGHGLLRGKVTILDASSMGIFSMPVASCTRSSQVPPLCLKNASTAWRSPSGSSFRSTLRSVNAVSEVDTGTMASLA